LPKLRDFDNQPLFFHTIKKATNKPTIMPTIVTRITEEMGSNNIATMTTQIAPINGKK